ncbi:hypothetical protein D3C76_771650 [compost metagenome]
MRGHRFGTEGLPGRAGLPERFPDDTDGAGQCIGIAVANQPWQASGTRAVLPPHLNLCVRQFAQPLAIDLWRKFADVEHADVQRRVELAGKILELALQRLPAIERQKVQVIQLHGQVPAADRELPVFAQCLLSGQRLPQLRLPVGGQPGAVQFIDALVIGRVHAQPQDQIQALGPGQFQAAGEPAIGAAEVGVAVGRPLHDHRVRALAGAGLPDPLPLRLAQVGIDIEWLIENPLVGMGRHAAQQHAQGQ